jgi:hypothetical protein
VNAQGLNQVISPGVDIFPAFNPATTLSSASPGSISISTFDKNFKPSDTQIWDLNLQQSFTNSVILQIGYVGSKGTHLRHVRHQSQ